MRYRHRSDAATQKRKHYEIKYYVGEKGAAGKPGELKGNFDLLCSIGELHANTNCGIFGTLDKAARPREIQPIPVAKRSEIKAGEAVILSNINGTSVEEYKIEISRIYPRNEANTRDMMITVRDERLIEATGGIVQEYERKSDYTGRKAGRRGYPCAY